MAYIIDPNAPLPVPPVSATSSDGKLKAVLDPANSGVQLWANFQTDPGSPEIEAQPERIMRTNRWKVPYYNGIAPWSIDGTGQALGAGATYQGKPSLRTTASGSPVRLGLRNVGGGSAYFPNLEAGKTFWFSADVYVSANAVGDTITALMRDDPNNDSVASTILATLGTANVKGGWTRFAVKFTVNAGRTITAVYLRGASGTQPNGAYMDTTRWLVEETTPDSAAPSTYFDGDTPASGGYSNRWTGVVDGSTSQQYVPAIPYSPAVPPTWPSGLSSIRFERTDGTVVRSGDPARASGAVATAYDHEAPLGAISNWIATPIFADGTEGAPSTPVALTVPEPLGLKDVWLKSTTDPGLSVRVTVTGEVPELTYEARETVTDVFGSAYPSISWDSWSAVKCDGISFLVETAEDRIALQKCLTSGIVLMQTAPGFDWPDMYVKFSSISRARLGSIRSAGQTLSASFVEVERPATEDSPSFVPGRAWADIQRVFADWQSVKDAYTDAESIVSVAS